MNYKNFMILVALFFLCQASDIDADSYYEADHEKYFVKAGKKKPGRIILDPAKYGFGTINNQADLMIKIDIFWAEKGLTFKGEITDDHPLKNSQYDADIYDGDCFEFAWSTDRGKKLDRTEYTSADHQLGVAMKKSGKIKEDDIYLWQPEEKSAEGVKGEIKKTKKGYSFEVFLPAAMLGGKLKKGDKIPFNIAIDDDDDGGGRKYQEVFSQDENIHLDPSTWGLMELVN